MEIAHYLFLLKDAGLPCSSVVKNPNANAGKAEDAGSIPGSGRSPGERNGSPCQYSCLKNPMDRGAWPGWRILSITLLACEIRAIVQ